MNRFKKLLLSILLIFSFLIFTDAHSQSITFSVNIKHQLDNDIFNPETDQVQLIGNRHPLSNNSPLEMKPAENDSTIYKITVEFLPSLSGAEVEYSFRLNTRFATYREDMPRVARIPEESLELTPLYFNSYAW